MKKDKGFTLIEVIIIVTIIAFLFAFIVYSLRNQIFKGYDAKRKGDMHKIQVAFEEYEKDHDCYPDLIRNPEIINCNPGLGLRPYLNKVPCEPSTKSDYIVEVDDSVCPSWYRIYAKLENDSDVDIGELDCNWGCGPEYAFNFYISSYNAPSPLIRLAPETSISEEPPMANFYGCINGICQRIAWDPERPGPVCIPNYQDPNCYDKCGPESKECLSWKL